MKYVAAMPSVGRVGHQFSQIFSARWFATAFNLEYRHADFVDGPAWNDKAAAWNAFFDFSRGVARLEEIQHTTMSLRLSRPVPPRGAGARWPTFEDYRQLARTLPDEWSLYFADYGTCWYSTYPWRPNLFRDVARWFQGQALNSPAYQAQPTESDDASKVSIVGYYRTGGSREPDYRHQVVPVDQYLAGLYAVVHFLGDHAAKPIVYTQGPASLFKAAGNRIAVRRCDDEYPEVFTAMKTCIEADVFMGSTGGTNSLIRTLRHGRRVSFGFESKRAVSAYPDGPNIGADGRLWSRDKHVLADLLN